MGSIVVPRRQPSQDSKKEMVTIEQHCVIDYESSSQKTSTPLNYADDIKEIKEKYEDLKAKLEVATASHHLLSKREYEQEVHGVVVKKVYHKVKFVLDDEQLLDIKPGSQSIGGIVLDELRIPEEQRPPFWKTYKHVVGRALSHQRANNGTFLKKEFLGL